MAVLRRRQTLGNDDWPELARRLPIGQKRRAFHSCSRSFSKTNFEYGRTSEGVWCHCHRCGHSDFKPTNHAPYVPPAKEQVKVPTDVVPLTEVIAKQPGLLLPCLEKYGLLPHLSVLTASPTYGRIYLPDDSASFCGLDYTGRQFIPWRSPHNHSMAVTIVPPRPDLVVEQGNDIWVYGDAADYLEHVRQGGSSAAFVADTNDTTVRALVSVVLAYRFEVISLDHPKSDALRRELRVCGKVRTL